MKRRLGMETKFTYVLCVSTIVLLILLFVILSVFTLHSEKNTYLSNARAKIDNAEKLIDRQMYSVLDIGSNVAGNELILDILSTNTGDDLTVLMEDYKFMDKFFASFMEYGKGNPNMFFVIYPTNENLPVGLHIEKLESLRKDKLWAELEKIDDYNVVWSTESEDGQLYLSCYRRIVRYKNELGYLKISLPFRNICIDLENISLEDREEIKYINTFDEVLYPDSVNSDSEKTFTTVRTLVNGDSLIISAPKTAAMSRCYTYISILGLVFLLITIAIYFIYKSIVLNITKELFDFVSAISNDGTISIDENYLEGNDRMVMMIKRKFHDLIVNINTMHDRIDEINKEKKKAELEFLQMNFNPHMLYNSLSSIRWRLLISGEKEMATLVEHMTAYYRKVLSKGNNIITVKEEIEMLYQYIKIMETSYHRNITLTVDAPETLMDSYIIKQLLQPIVENAVLHGTNGVVDERINIKIEKEESDLIFCIFNNGHTISDEEIEHALGSNRNENYKGGYGIVNTIKRIETYYGKEYGLTMRGIKDKGTEVVVRIENLDKDTIRSRMQ